MRERRAIHLEPRWAMAFLLVGLVAPDLRGEEGFSCSLDPRKATRNVGEAHSVTMTIEHYGAPYPGSDVNFRVTGGPNAGIRGSSVTDNKGEATFEYDGSGGSGTDAIEAVGSTYGGNISCTATVTWKQQQGTNVDLEISWTGYVVQEAAIATAHVTRNGAAVKGASVEFEVISGPHKGEKGTSTTDVSGRAVFTIPGNGLLGTDRVRAEANATASRNPDSQATSPSYVMGWSEADAAFCEIELTGEGWRTVNCHDWLAELINCLLSGLGGVAPQSAALGPERMDLYHGLRDSVLGKSARGRQYVKLYYELSGEALDIVAKNPRLIPRVLDILEAEDPLIRELVATGSGTVGEHERQKIDDLLRDLAPSGSDRFWNAVNELRNNLYDNEALKELGITVR